MRPRLSIIVKLSLLVASAVSLTALAVNEVYVRGSNKILVERALSDLEKEAEFFQYPLKGAINQLQDDARLLSQLSATKGLMMARLQGGVDPQDHLTAEQSANRLATTFSEMLRTREHYRRIRFVGVEDEGKEILQVERFGNLIERAPDRKLHHLSGETYFQGSLGLGPDEIYLSEPNLERVDGELYLPHTLTLRVVVPIFTPDRDPFGAIVINIDFGAVLEDIKEHVPGGRNLYVANASGDYLLHPDPSLRYATDLSHERRIQRDYPKLLGVFSNPKESRAILMPENPDRGTALAFQKCSYDSRDPANYLGVAVEAPYRSITSETEAVERRGFLFSAAIALLAVTVGIIHLRHLVRPLNRVADAVVRYRQGETEVSLPVESGDEIGVLAREFATMIEQKNDEDWVKENLVNISRGLLGFKDLRRFADSLMDAVTPAIGAQIGAFYMSSAFGRDQSRETETLALLGACGYESADLGKLPRSFRWGEGLIGGCARSGKRVLVSDIPADYLRITSGLGDTRPTHLLLLPVQFENRLVGVLELATVGEFTPLHLAFLEQLSFNVGVILNSIIANVRTVELLEEARLTAEELQRSEEELKTQQEELEASNEELEEKTKALEEQNARIRQQTREIEEAKRVIEEKMRELERSSEYKSEFLANMSHELRTPLNSLLILARTLAANEEGNLTGEQIEEARVIHSGGLELLGLINDILDLSKVEAGKMSIRPEEVGLSEIVKRLSQQFEPVAKESAVAFHIRVDDRVPAMLHTDAQRVEQILKNLLSNAFKFTKRGSVTLEIQAHDRRLDLQRAGLAERAALTDMEWIAFSIVDTGIGIDESKLKDVFEAFQQEDGSIDRHYGGTGLGLTIARKFAHLLSGEIRVKSKKGEGSTFTLILPARVEASQRAEAMLAKQLSISRSAPGSGATHPVERASNAIAHGQREPADRDGRPDLRPADKVILVIEDDRDFAGVLAKLTRARGYTCLLAHDGKSGLLLALEQPVSAVILDLRLPDIDGLEVLDQLKHDLRTRHIPVHVITGRDDTDALVPLRQGAIGYLNKPVGVEEIDGVLARIDTVLAAGVKKLLVVEDDKNTQTAISALLKRKGVDLTMAGTGRTALEQIARTRFDCIVLDLTLPDMTGFEWLAAAERQAGSADLPPVVVHTARELDEEENRRLSALTSSIIIKGASSSDRLLDEVTLFLHSVASTLSEDQQAVIRMQHDPDRVLKGRSVLLVDDDLRNTFALSKLLKKQGMEIVMADNGEMALEKLREEPGIELVIMDIMMPVMDGYQAIREIRATPAWKALPVIALTARAMPEEQERCIEAGANDYLVKPVDIDRLITLLRVWLFRQEMAA